MYGIPRSPARGLACVGHTYEEDFGPEGRYQLHFSSETSVTVRGLAGPNQGTSETTRVTLFELGPGVLMASWRDATGNTVVQVQDFENQVVHAAITLPDENVPENSQLIRMTGTLTQRD